MSTTDAVRSHDRLEGKFAVNIHVTEATGPFRDLVGRKAQRTYSFTPTCRSGSCPTIPLMERAEGQVLVRLGKVGHGRYRGSGSLAARCSKAVPSRGSHLRSESLAQAGDERPRSPARVPPPWAARAAARSSARSAEGESRFRSVTKREVGWSGGSGTSGAQLRRRRRPPTEKRSEAHAIGTTSRGVQRCRRGDWPPPLGRGRARYPADPFLCRRGVAASSPGRPPLPLRTQSVAGIAIRQEACVQP